MRNRGLLVASCALTTEWTDVKEVECKQGTVVRRSKRGSEVSVPSRHLFGSSELFADIIPRPRPTVLFISVRVLPNISSAESEYTVLTANLST